MVAPTDYGWIDVNVEVGPRAGNAGGAEPDLVNRERLDHGVATSLVRDRVALLADTRLGNGRLLELCRANPAFRAVAVIRAERTDTLADAERLAPEVAAFWIDGVAEWHRPNAARDAILTSVGRAGRPLFVPISHAGEATAIGAATAGLGLPVILVGHHYMNAVDTVMAARRYDHLAIETSSMAHLGAVEIAVDRLGVERVYLGTDSPLRSMQAPINAVLSAAISDDAKRAILAGNAARTFGLPARPIELPPVWKPDRIIDVHTHTGPFRVDVTQLRDDELVPELRRRTNTDIAIASSLLAIIADTDAGNAQIVDGCRTIPNRLGYLVADPNDLDTTREHIRRWGDAPGIVGAKIHCQWSNRHTGSRAIRDLFAVLADWGKPVKIYNDGDDWADRLLEIARAHPRLTIIAAHGGLGAPSLEGARLVAQADNVYLEMCSSAAELPIVRQVVGIVPPHKLLYGTDAPLLETSFVLGTYQDAGIAPEHRAAAYADNAARIFDLASGNSPGTAGRGATR